MLHTPVMIVANNMLDALSVISQGTGLWGGLREPVYALAIDSPEQEQRLLSVAKDKGEAYVVILDANRIAHLVDTSGTLDDVRLGKWESITPSQAESRDAWTRLNGQYYAAV